MSDTVQSEQGLTGLEITRICGFMHDREKIVLGFCSFLFYFIFNFSLILISVAVTLPNEKVIRLNRSKIELCKVAKIDGRLYVEGGEGEE